MLKLTKPNTHCWAVARALFDLLVVLPCIVFLTGAWIAAVIAAWLWLRANHPALAGLATILGVLAVVITLIRQERQP